MDCAPNCARCDVLEEEIAYLRSELGLQTELTMKRGLSRSLGLSPGELSLALALYRAKGRVVTSSFLEEILPDPRGNAGERTLKLVQVYVCRLRRTLGFDAIDTIWGQGYQLMPKGREIIREALEGPRQVAA